MGTRSLGTNRQRLASGVLAGMAVSALIGLATPAQAESNPAETPNDQPVTVTANRQVPVTTFTSVTARATRTVVVHRHGRTARATRSVTVSVRLPAHAVGSGVASCTDVTYELASGCANSSAQRAARSDAAAQLEDVVRRELPALAQERATKAATKAARRAALRKL